MKLNASTADSLILAVVDLLLAISGFLLLPTSYSAWIIVVCWVLLPPLLVITLFYWGRDLRHPATHKQALVAALISSPVVTLEVWFFANLRL